MIVAAGMEGALPSVVGGLVEAPVIAVPTSVGYGASFQGLAALLAMLNSCASASPWSTSTTASGRATWPARSCAVATARESPPQSPLTLTKPLILLIL